MNTASIHLRRLDQSKSQQLSLERTYFDVASFILIHALAIVLVSYIDFCFSLDTLKYKFLLCFVLILSLFWYLRTSNPENAKQDNSLFLSIIAFSYLIIIALAGTIFDVSFDGQNYHFYAIERLTQSWNPLQQPEVESVWATGYPKFSWLLAAAVSSFTGNLEAGKAFNLLFIEASLLLAVLFFSSMGLGKATSFRVWLCSFLVAFNPVSIYQSFNNYVDGQLASIFLCLLLSIVLFLQSRSLKFVVVQSVCLITLPNLKFTGLVYAAIAIIILGIYYTLEPCRKENWKTYSRQLIVVAVGATIIGFNPYVTNLVNHGYLFYPLSEEGAAIVSGSAGAHAPIVSNGNQLNNLLKSLSSVPDNDAYYTEYTPIFQANFSTVLASLSNYAKPDTRFNGFGILFIFSLVLSLPVLLRQLATRSREKFRELLPLAIILLTAFSNPYLWVARYIPQFYYLPFFMIASPNGRAKPTQTVNLILLTLAANQLVLAAIYFGYNLYATAKYYSFLADYGDDSKILILENEPKDEFSAEQFPAIPYRFNRYGISFVNREKGYCQSIGKEYITIAPMSAPPLICAVDKW